MFRREIHKAETGAEKRARPLCREVACGTARCLTSWTCSTGSGRGPCFFSGRFLEVNKNIFFPKTYSARTVLDGCCEEKGQRDHQEQHSVNHVRRRLCGGAEERKGKSSSKAKTAKLAKKLADCTASGGLCKECKGQRDQLEQPSGDRVRRRLDGEENKVHQGGKEMASPLVRQRQGQPKNLQSAPHWAASARSVKTRSTRPSRTIWCVPCQAEAGLRDRDRAHQGGQEMEDSQSVPYRTASGRRVTKRSLRPSSTI
jgi:hypothetical protein